MWNVPYGLIAENLNGAHHYIFTPTLSKVSHFIASSLVLSSHLSELQIVALTGF